MEEAAVGAVVLLCLLVFLLHADSELKRSRTAADTERRRATRRRTQRQLLVRVLAEVERVELRRRRRMRMLMRLLAQRCSPTVWTHRRADEWWTTVVPSFDDQQWVQNFRMSRETFELMCRRLQPALEKSDTNYRLSVPLHKRVAIALWKLATNSEYRSVAQLFAVGISTACACLREFCSSVEEILLPEVIQIPDAESQREMARFFEQKWGLQQCIGAIGGLHVPILAPRENRYDYFNPKGWYSVVLQAVVDGRGWFWSVIVGQPGSLDDAAVLQASELWELAETKKLFSQHEGGYHILGNATHPLTDWLVKPFQDDGCLTPQQALFNHRTGQARAAVDNAFTRLKGRWRCLRERNDCSLERVTSMVLACCVLHNLCESRGEEYREEWGPSLHQTVTPLLPPGGRTAGTGLHSALMHNVCT